MVVTRFAPSPTGYLHIGGARTALFCWLMARHAGGKFILRIEDTDQKRNTPTARKQVIEDLRWLGIEWDEGPEVGGENGPYLQSQRLDIYKSYADKLLESGQAYYCFETAAELAEKRKRAEKDTGGFVYRKPQQVPSAEDAEKVRAAGKEVTVRFAIPQGEKIVVEDIVRGKVEFAPATLSDFVIVKSDGFPTYNFACVVDDELMDVTHVIRGQEHLMNTPGQQALQNALGFRRPVYVHMSVTISEGGGKLSKRERPKVLREAIKSLEDVDSANLAEAGGISVEDVHSFIDGKSTPDMPSINAMAEALGVHLPEINVVDFRRGGYLPEAMVNFLALLGWNPGDDREVMSVNELIEAFDLGRLTKSNSLFDRKKLVSFNTEHMRMVGRDKLICYLKDYLEAVESVVPADNEVLLKRLIEVNEGARTLSDIELKSRFLFIGDEDIEYDEKAVKKVLLKHNGLSILSLVGERLAGLDEISPESVESILRGLAEERQVGLGKVAQPLRVAICGNMISPPIFDSVEMLGKERTLSRIEITLKKFGEKTGTLEV
jgi:glutamyl/glutaminyl-tRNA synthetase